MAKVKSKMVGIARVLLGLVFVVFGLNGFLNFLPQPDMPVTAGAFMGALAATGYMFPLIKLTEIVAGILLLTNRFVPLALIILAPVVVNIVGFHIALAPPNPVTFLVLGAELFLAWSYRERFAALFVANARPTTA